MSISGKASSVFTKESEESKYASEYLTELRTNWRDTEKFITRASALIVVIAILFELVLADSATGGSIFGFELSNPSFIRLTLPVIVTYLYYSVTFSWVESLIFQDIHDAIVENLYPKIYDNDLERALHPSNSLVSSADRVYYSVGRGTREGLLSELSGGIRPLAIAIASPIFGIIAYIQLFERYGVTNALLWISVVISVVFLVSGFVNWYIFLGIAA